MLYSNSMTLNRNLMPIDCFPRTLPKFKVEAGNQIWKSVDNKRFYTWDESHGGEVEVFNKRGKHIGVMNCQGIAIKPAVRGRKINV